MKRILSLCLLALFGCCMVMAAEDNLKPSFPGGQESLDKFLEHNLRKPETVKDNNIRGRVVCQFTVDENGSVTDIKIIRSSYPAMNDEILRVLQYMPRWEPAQEDGKPVTAEYTATMNYYLP